jgi:hypothetical protein
LGLSEAILAAMIGAIATVGTAMFQLISNWRVQTSERKSRRGGFRSLMMLLAIMLACAVAGYAFSEYHSQELRDETRALRGDLQQQVKALSMSTERLEQLHLNAQTAADGQARAADDRRRGIDGAEALVQIPACRGLPGASPPDRLACAESDAMRVAVCSVIPAKAQVTEVLLFTRYEDSQEPWSDTRVTAGQDAGSARFLETAFERSHTDTAKEVCFNFAHWGADKTRLARIVVRYAM